MRPKARWVAAAAVGAVVALAGVAVVMSTATVTAAGNQVSPACASPAPTPSLPPLPTATSAPIPCSTPTPAPTAAPTPHSTNSPGPNATPVPGSSGPNNPSGGPAGAASKGALTTPSVVPGTLVVADPLLAAQLNAVLQDPVSRQHPDLLHFTPASADAGIDPPAPTSLSWSDAAAGVVLLQPALALVAAGLLLGVAAVTLATTRLPTRARLAVAAVPSLVAVPLSVGALVLMAPAAPAAALTGATSPAAYAAPIGLLREHAAAMQAANVAPWNDLVGIESTLSQQHSRLLSDETEIDALTNELNAISSTATAPQTERPSAFAILTSDLAQALSDHQATLAVYQQSLANEYDFFAGAVTSPEQTNQLQAVVAQKPPDVQAAVNTDISLVQTELQQEAVIASAARTKAPSLSAPVLPPGVTITFHAPLSGVVTQGFGPSPYSMEPPVTYKGVFYPHFHTGLDIAAPLGTPVGAAAAGKVILATSSIDSQGHLVGYGNYVVIAHGDGFLTLYGHLEKILVTAGQEVQQGQVIGLEGATGNATGPHVHFEIRLNGIYVDPAPYLAHQLRG